MRVLISALVLLFSLLGTVQLDAQVDSSEIFKVVEQAPLFPGCHVLRTADEQKECSEKNLLRFVYQNLVYPEEALAQKLEGMVVINFVIEKDGSISGAKVLKDIGGGCGDAALAAVNLINDLEQKWTPGMNKGIPARVYFNLPIRFKEPKEMEYYVEGRDSIWIKYDEAPVFEGGLTALDEYLDKELRYPKGGLDSCAIGVIECATVVRANGQIVVLETKDYNNLGFDYETEASRTIISSMSKWTPAIYQGRKVSSAYNIRMNFKPNTAACKTQVDNFAKAYELADEGVKLFEAQSIEEAIEKYNAALALFPENAEFLILRGQAFFELQRIGEACTDLQKVKGRLIHTVYNNILPMICVD